MKLVIDIDENVYTRLFDNGIEDYAIVTDDLFTIAKSIRNAIPLTEDTDLISRKAVKELLDEYYAELTLDETALKTNAIAIKVTRHIINDIEVLPSVNPTTNDLNKIRAEIENEMVHDDWDIGNESIYNNAIRDVLAIIDKYRKGGGSNE